VKIQISKWLIIIATFVSLMFVVTGLEAGKPGNGNPNKPGKNKAELIVFTGDLEGWQEVEGCCLNSGPNPAYTMHLSYACGDLHAGEHPGHLYISVWDAGGNPTAMVEFWIEGGDGFYLIGGDIDWVKKTKYLKVTFRGEDCYNHFDQISELPPPPTTTGTASFVLYRSPAD
jgi:hypothetical protein